MSEKLAPKQSSLRRLRAFGVRPDRELGQNFLIDDNLLGVIAELAQLAPQDVVLEVGGGLGLLSERLADRCTFVHVIELDQRLRDPLEQAVGARPNVALHFGDAMRMDLGALLPPPGKLVANLPYSIAAPLVVETVTSLPSVLLWCVMVQREIADRLAASPGTREYGGPSVLVQLSCEVEQVRPVSRTVFTPVPNVDSALVVLRRRRPPPTPATRALVTAAFAHRRKTLARSVAVAVRARPELAAALAPAGGDPLAPREVAARLQGLLEGLGEPSGQRAERLAPAAFAELAAALAGGP